MITKSESPLAIITGGTSGIGAATAERLLSKGYRVVATGLFEDDIQRCRQNPVMAGVDYALLDVTDSDAVAEFFGQFDCLAALVNCAGIGRSPDEFSEAGFMKTLDINLHGTMRCCYAALSALKKGRGGVINIASIVSVFGSAGAPAYSASKGAIMQFTKSLAVAWGEHGIRVNAVAPGWTETPMTTAMQADEPRNQRILERTPLQRWGRADEIAKGIDFLLSDDASFITGAMLPIDGGYMVVAS